MAVGLIWFGFTTNNPSPIPSLTSLALAIVSFILGAYLTSSGLRRLENIQSPLWLRKVGTIIFVVGIVVVSYAATACFLIRSLPPNDDNSRLPSINLLYMGMFVMLVGAVARNFRLR
jgi:membrane-bound metal-dependent hydrolase YbcI (DUF457 family)